MTVVIVVRVDHNVVTCVIVDEMNVPVTAKNPVMLPKRVATPVDCKLPPTPHPNPDIAVAVPVDAPHRRGTNCACNRTENTNHGNASKSGHKYAECVYWHYDILLYGPYLLPRFRNNP